MSTSLKEVTYTTSAEAHGGRSGHVTSGDGVIDLDLRRPGSVSNPQANPETLLAAGYAACFQSALESRAKAQGVDTSGSTVTARVSLGPAEDGGFGLAVAIEAQVPGVGRDQAQELVEQAHQLCPYSRATRGNIDVTVRAI
ncbi:MAG: organic hydroperoxide resistance protein [Actinomycetota bacterium]|nr:organic hydroperoxide resistance protein [Actinomycetota bacterium]